MIKDEDTLSREIIGDSIEVHSHLGPGLLESVCEAQLLTYLKSSALKLGILINFNVPLLKKGTKRIVYGL
ncbi:MAG: hypothetical protein DCC43_04295 [Candidatus Brocadia sp.]|nr:hypothetical protein [Candidatus Brocadia sp.]MCE7911862.1 hypothetical protein [Candidatus Brocadia sp. AMX3]MDG5997539.1 hypothetical protein [Candidatus Brocadia sp.]RIK02093.1 MAG: hypothetical protein DCC43_04295 [Candidatus Brocadia sp.]